MERNINVLKLKTSNSDSIKSLDSPKYHSIKLKSRLDANNIAIENVEFIMEESNQASPRKNILKHIYKEKENPLNSISKEINKKQIHKKIKNQKSNMIYPIQKKMYNVIKKYINGKQDKEKESTINATFKKPYPISYKNIQNLNKEKLIHKSQSNPSITKPQEMNMESNFMKLSKEANIYTSNAKYIQNKKVLLFDKFSYDNNEYVPDRAKLFDMTRMPKIPKKNSFVFKTTKFRVGHFINNNKDSNNALDSGRKNEFANKSLFDFNYRYLEINKGNLSYNENNKQNSLIKNYDKSITQNSYIDNSFQKFKRHPPSDTFYKELMSKKNETYEQYFKSPNKEKEKEKEMNVDENIDSNELNLDTNDKDMRGFLQPYYKNKLNKKKPELKRLYYKQIINNNKNDLNGYSVLLSKKKNNMGNPLYFPKIFSSNINFENHSQKERFEKISESFAALKNLMENFKKQGELDELDFIFDYAVSKNIDKSILTIKNLNNFYNFLNEKQMPLDPKKSLKENIILALNYGTNLNNEEKQKKSKIILNNKEKTKSNFFITTKSSKNKKKINDTKEIKLMLDLNLQKKINNKDNFSIDNINTRDELKKEIEDVNNEVLNKQKIIENIRNNDEKIKNYEKVFDSNERLYYTWFKNQRAKDINNYRKKSKLTELYYYNKTKEEMKKNDLEQKYFGE